MVHVFVAQSNTKFHSSTPPLNTVRVKPAAKRMLPLSTLRPRSNTRISVGLKVKKCLKVFSLRPERGAFSVQTAGHISLPNSKVEIIWFFVSLLSMMTQGRFQSFKYGLLMRHLGFVMVLRLWLTQSGSRGTNRKNRLTFQSTRPDYFKELPTIEQAQYPKILCQRSGVENNPRLQLSHAPGGGERRKPPRA